MTTIGPAADSAVPVSHSSTPHSSTPHSSIRRLRGQSLLSLFGAGAGAIAGFGLVLAATRLMTPDEAGAALLAIAVFSIVSRVAQVGAGTAVVHFMTTRNAVRPDRGLADLFAIAIPLVLAVSTALALGLWFSADALSSLVETNGSHTTLADALRWSAPFIPVAALLTVILDATRGYTEMRPTVLIGRIGRPAAQLLGVIVIAAAGGGARELVLAWTASAVPALVVAYVWLRRMHAARVLRDPVPYDPAPYEPVPRHSYLSVALPQTGVDTIRTLVRWQDGIVIGILLGAGPAALYVAVTRLVKVASLVNQAFSETVAPHVGEALGHGDMQRAGQLYRASTWWLVLLLGPIYLVTAAYAEFFSGIFGSEYTAAANVLVILALGKFAGTLVGSVEAVLIVDGHTTVNLGNHVTSLVSNLGLNLLLVPWLGLEGAAIAWVVSILITNYGPYVQLRARTGLSPFDRTTWFVIGAVMIAVALPAAAVHALAGPTFLPVMVGAAISMALLFAGACRHRHVLHLDDILGRSETSDADTYEAALA